MTDPTALAPLRTELIATCDLLRFDQLDPLRFCHESDAFRAAFASEVELYDIIEQLDDAYDPRWHGRAPIPADHIPPAIYRLHMAAHVARTRTFEPLYDCIASWPEPALVALLSHARSRIEAFILPPTVAPLPFPLTCAPSALAHLADHFVQEAPLAA